MPIYQWESLHFLIDNLTAFLTKFPCPKCSKSNASIGSALFKLTLKTDLIMSPHSIPSTKKLQLSSSKLNCFQIPELLNPFVNPVFCGKNAMVVTENGEMRSINDVLWFALDKPKEMYCWGGTNSILIVMTECVAWS